MLLRFFPRPTCKIEEARLKRGDADVNTHCGVCSHGNLGMGTQRVVFASSHHSACHQTGLRQSPIAGAAPEFNEDDAAGRTGPALENCNGSLFYSCLLDHHTFAINTFYSVGPYVRINYIALRQLLREAVEDRSLCSPTGPGGSARSCWEGSHFAGASSYKISFQATLWQLLARKGDVLSGHLAT